MKLLNRNEFREGVFKRDKYKCVICGAEGKDAHHILERRLFKEEAEFGGYFLENGSTLCEKHHLLAENTELSCETIRNACGIAESILPKHLTPHYQYDKWGNILLSDGRKLKGELFYEEPVQKVLAPFFGQFVKYVPYPFLLNENESRLENQGVVVLQEITGEKRVLYNDYIHSNCIEVGLIDENWHQIKDLIDENMFICAIKAENEFYLSFVGIDHEYLSWQETQEYANILNMKTLPVIYEGIYKEKIAKKGACFVRIKKAFSRYSCSKSVFQL